MSSFRRAGYARVPLRTAPPSAAPLPVALPPKVIPIKITTPRYRKPSRDDLAVVIPFFNPTQSLRLMQNVLLTTSFMKQASIPFYIVELAFDDAPFLFSEGETVFQYRSSSYMFYKENLFVTAEPRIPNKYTKLLFLDSDILFEAEDWYDRISEALDIKQVIQPFSIAYWLRADFVPEKSRGSVFVPEATETHKGFAWAFRRDWYASAGIFEYALTGGGDSLFYARTQLVPSCRPHLPYLADFQEMHGLGLATTGYIAMNIYHLFHGLLQSRQYGTREETLWKYMQSYGVSKVSSLVERRADGILEWLPAVRDAMNGLLLSFFRERKDDGI